MKQLIKENSKVLIPVIGSVVLYLFFAYKLERSDFLNFLLLYAGLCYCAWRIIEFSNANFWVLASFGVLVRLLFLPAIPNLSQDFYRFLWDGRVLIQGVNPYLFTPEQYFENLTTAFEGVINITINQATELRNGMGDLNAHHYSNYPPVNQLCFAIAALFAKGSILGSVITLRLLMILADLGILYFGKKLLEQMKLPVKNILWYFLNPFIIIELTGNLHFEGVMLLFVIWSLYLIHKGKWFWAAVFLGISVSVKLLPLLMLPLFFKYLLYSKNAKTSILGLHLDQLSISKMILFYTTVLGTVLLTFAPFLSQEFISNFAATIGLWFQNFEFNASVYYVIRWIGFKTVGWNIIGTVGKILPLIVITVLLAMAFFRPLNTSRDNQKTQQLITGILLGVSLYFLLSTTVHPWYVATPLVLSVFTRYKFPIVWSFMVVFSYSAYGVEDFQENLGLVAMEYSVVIVIALWELLKPQHFVKTFKISA